MDILFVATELAPVVRASALADVVFALSKTLKNLGHKVTIAMPRYAAFEHTGVLAARRLTPLALPKASGNVPREVTVFDGRLASGVELVLFDAKLADGTGLYADVTDPSGKNLYDKDGAQHPLATLRAAVLCRATIEFLRQRVAGDKPFDVVHAHDWSTAMVPYLMRLAPELAAVQSVFSIHDVRRQGMYEAAEARAVVASFGLGEDHFTPARLEFYGGVNLLKAGLIAADGVTTVSPTYAREIATAPGGYRLDGVVRARKEPIAGILNGLDYSVWNPATDPALVARYDADDPANKTRCKTTLLAELGLELDPARPLFVAFGPLDADRGGDVLAAALPRVLKQDMTLVVAAKDGTDAIEAALRRSPERAKLVKDISDASLHRYLAAADFVVLPHRYEPCGTLQVCAQRYGAVPVASLAAGHRDTVVDLDAALETGTGLVFEPGDPDALVGGIGRALAAFTHPRFSTVRRRVMRVDVSWDRPARRYVQVYKQVVQRAAEVAAADAATQQATSPS